MASSADNPSIASIQDVGGTVLPLKRKRSPAASGPAPSHTMASTFNSTRNGRSSTPHTSQLSFRPGGSEEDLPSSDPTKRTATQSASSVAPDLTVEVVWIGFRRLGRTKPEISGTWSSGSQIAVRPDIAQDWRVPRCLIPEQAQLLEDTLSQHFAFAGEDENIIHQEVVIMSALNDAYAHWVEFWQGDWVMRDRWDAQAPSKRRVLFTYRPFDRAPEKVDKL